MSRILFRINSDNTTTTLDNDFHEYFIEVTPDGDGSIVEVSIVESNPSLERYNSGV